MRLRRFILVLLVLTCLVAVLASCASNDAGWEMKPDAPPLPAYFVDSAPAQIRQACPKTANVIGCAVRHYDIGKCFIYVEPDAPKWLATHELTHCAGFNHP